MKPYATSYKSPPPLLEHSGRALPALLSKSVGNYQKKTTIKKKSKTMGQLSAAGLVALSTEAMNAG